MNNLDYTFYALAFMFVQMLGIYIPILANASTSAMFGFYIPWFYFMTAMLNKLTGYYAISADVLEDVNTTERVFFTIYIILTSIVATSLISNKYGGGYGLLAGLLGAAISYIPKIPSV
jgi:hypothetical protein